MFFKLDRYWLVLIVLDSPGRIGVYRFLSLTENSTHLNFTTAKTIFAKDKKKNERLNR